MRLRPVLGRAGEAWRDIRAADPILTVTSGGPGGTVIPLLISIRDSFSLRGSPGARRGPGGIEGSGGAFEIPSAIEYTRSRAFFMIGA